MPFNAGYTETIPAPPPLELGCSNPLRPCLLEGFLVSDPPLQQVVGGTPRRGSPGKRRTPGGRGAWKLGLFRTDSQSDIIQVCARTSTSSCRWTAPACARQGLEAGVNYQT